MIQHKDTGTVTKRIEMAKKGKEKRCKAIIDGVRCERELKYHKAKACAYYYRQAIAGKPLTMPEERKTHNINIAKYKPPTWDDGEKE